MRISDGSLLPPASGLWQHQNRKEFLTGMGGIFGVASKNSCVMDVFFGTDYHSHLGTRRGGMVVYDADRGFDRAIHNIENSPFRTKFEQDAALLAYNKAGVFAGNVIFAAGQYGEPHNSNCAEE